MQRLEKTLPIVLACILLGNLAWAGSAEDAWTTLVGKKFAKRPAFAFVKGDPELPNILIYGDSISIDYTQRVREKLKGKANVYRIYCNGADTASVIPVMKKMHDAMGEHWSFKWDVIHFNAGLHDLKYLDENKRYNTNTGTQVRSPEEYVKQLKGIFAYFKELAPNSRVIFATTTPVPEESRGRKAGDAAKFNDAALGMLKDYPEVAINDLYALTKPNQTKWWIKPGNVHFNKIGSNAQGDEVARVILKVLSDRGQSNKEQAGKLIMLWPKDVASQDTKGMGTLKPGRREGSLRLTDITQPYLRYFPAPGQEAPRPVVIVSPGGGYMHIGSNTTRYLIAEWLNEHGISAFILHYRVPKKRKEAYQDIQRAVRIVRSRAAEWNIDPERIGVMATSAGGHLSARVSTGYDIPSYEAVDELDGASCKPDFTVLLCPAYMNKGKALRKEFTVTDELSPTLIITCKDDGFFPGSEIYAKALEEAGASVRTHFFEKGGHGIGIRTEKYPLSTWPDLYLQWLRDIKIIEKETEPENAPDKK